MGKLATFDDWTDLFRKIGLESIFRDGSWLGAGQVGSERSH